MAPSLNGSIIPAAGRILRLVILTFLLCIGVVQADAVDSIGLTILHTNDTHGHLLPFSYPETVAPGSDMADLKHRRQIGGIARRAALARQIRAEQQVRNTEVWLVDAGDFSDGTAFSAEYRGTADIAAMNAAGYDFGTLGNHEFNRTASHVKKLLALADFPILCANVLEKNGRHLAPPYAVRTLGPLTVAVFGLLTHGARGYPAVRRGLHLLDEVETARRMGAELARRADIVIVLSHCGEAADHRIARSVPDIDVIIGGHSHSRLPTGKFVWHGDELKADDVNGTIIVQNHQWGGELGRLDLLFVRDDQDQWHVGRYRARLLPLTPGIPEDPAVAAVVQRFWKPIAGHYGEVIGRADADFVTRRHDRAEYHLMADAIRETFDTDVALENIGGVRAPLVRGPVTRADLVAMDPFDNTIVLFEISGAHLKRLLRKERPVVSGVRYRIVKGRLMSATCAGAPIADGKQYTGAVNSFYAGLLFKPTSVRDTGRKRRQVLEDYIRRKGRIAPAFDGRRIILNVENGFN